MRVPDTGAAVREKERVIAHLRDRLARFRKIPAHRRIEECADEGERDCLQLLEELGVTDTPAARPTAS